MGKSTVEGRVPVDRPHPGPAPRPRVLLGIGDISLQEEVLDYLDRDPRVDVVGAASVPDGLARLIVDTAPHVTVLCPELARQVHPSVGGRGGAIMVVAEEMSVPILREAIDAGAQGVFGWPEERSDLARSVAEFPSKDLSGRAARGQVIGVYGARGGAGATFVATHAAAALADRGRRCALVDLDADFAGLTVALGIGPDDPVRTISDLVPVADELSPEHLDDALFRHSRGFSVLFGAGEGDERVMSVGLYRGAIGLLAGAFDTILLHLPRALGDVARAGVGTADGVLLVASLDLFSLYGARRAIAGLGLNEPGRRCRLVINRMARASVTPRDVQRILGIEDWVGVRFDSAVARAQDRGELLSARSRRAGADMRSLVTQLNSWLRPDDGIGEA